MDLNSTPRFYYEITFPDFEPSDGVRADVINYLMKLENICNRIISCHVAVRAPHLHKRKHIYHISIHLEIPGEDIFVNHEPGKNIAHSDIHIAIRDAFKALHRQLRKRIKFLKKKTVPETTHTQAIIKSFDPNQGFGFLRDLNGREIYFHQNSLLNGGLDNLKAGTKVRFVEELGEKGIQVTSMSIL